jgi:hypothetical protein
MGTRGNKKSGVASESYGATLNLRCQISAHRIARVGSEVSQMRLGIEPANTRRALLIHTTSPLLMAAADDVIRDVGCAI